ncbi:MAG: Dabb family protein [Candidatus Giovannonibacteria bacterium]|nr:MAG: Dabb family protein [Candidatus Giovannonibacteria bacterium]
MQRALWHVVLISFKEYSTAVKRQEVYDRYQTLDQDCGGKEAGILFWKVDWNLDLRKNFHLVEIGIFESNEAFQAYRKHPKHVELTNILKNIADWRAGDIHYPAFLGKTTESSCPRCGEAMIKTRLYDPDGEIPLRDIVKIKGEDWVCVRCNNK